MALLLKTPPTLLYLLALLVLVALRSPLAALSRTARLPDRLAAAGGALPGRVGEWVRRKLEATMQRTQWQQRVDAAFSELLQRRRQRELHQPDGAGPTAMLRQVTSCYVRLRELHQPDGAGPTAIEQAVDELPVEAHSQLQSQPEGEEEVVQVLREKGGTAAASGTCSCTGEEVSSGGECDGAQGDDGAYGDDGAHGGYIRRCLQTWYRLAPCWAIGVGYAVLLGVGPPPAIGHR